MKHASVTWNRRKLKKYAFMASILAYPLLLFVVFWLFVNFNSILMAFQSETITGVKSFVGFRQFGEFISKVFGDGDIMSIAFKNSFIVYGINLVICMPLYILFSYLLYAKVPATRVIRSIVMIPQIVSSMIITLLFKKFVDNALPAIAEQLFGVTDFPLLLNDAEYVFPMMIFYMIWISFAFNLLVYTNAMNEVPEEIMESAHLDGVSNMFQELWYILLPSIWPTLTTFLVTGFAGILGNAGPLIAFYNTNAPADTYLMGYYYTVQVLLGNTQTYNMLAAGGLLMTAVVAPLTFAVRWALEKYGPKED